MQQAVDCPNFKLVIVGDGGTGGASLLFSFEHFIFLFMHGSTFVWLASLGMVSNVFIRIWQCSKMMKVEIFYVMYFRRHMHVRQRLYLGNHFMFRILPSFMKTRRN